MESKAELKSPVIKIEIQEFCYGCKLKKIDKL
jgi:hypothetical protein